MQKEKLLRIGLILLLVVNFYSLGKLNSINSKMDEQRNYLNNQMEWMLNEFRSAGNNISNFAQENQWIAGSHYKMNLDPKTEVITADINWTFRELAGDGEVYLII